MNDLYIAQHDALVQIHRALIDSLNAVRTAKTLDRVVPAARGAGEFLLGHHAAESTLLFPMLRRLGRLRSTDVAFLEACERAHHELHHLCERLLASAAASHPNERTIVALVDELLPAFESHVADEERGLAPDNLRMMLTEASIAELSRELEARRRSR